MSTSTATGRDRLQIVIGGHVDHGKSTIIGRLLADTGSLPDGKLAQIREFCLRTARPFEYAFLIDALKDERAQGITIEAARVFFQTPVRDYLIIDAPGHIEFLKNMVTGASRADAALLVIDAHEGIQENSRRHGHLMAMMGLRHVAVLVNKMDLVGFGHARFTQIEAEFRAFLHQVGVRPSHVIPVAGRDGDNIAARSARLPWYHGPTVREALEAFPAAQPEIDGPFRMPIQDVYKFTNGGDDRRIIAGTVLTGRARLGDELVFYPSGKRSAIKTFEAFNRPPQVAAGAGESVGVTLRDQIYVARGELATLSTGTRPAVSSRLRVHLFWLGRSPLVTSKTYGFKMGTARATMRVEAVHRVMDASSLATSGPAGVISQIERNEIADCTLACNRALAFDVADDVALTSRFVIVDDYEISGGGQVHEALPDRQVPARERVLRREHKWDALCTVKAGGPLTASVVWFTGLSGSGKTTLAAWVAAELRRAGRPVELLDGDAMRVVFPGTGFTRAERDEHVKRVGFLASRLEAHGVTVVASFISPYRESRDFVRAICRHFIEVHVATPIDECERRDVKGLYAKARRGEIARFTGISDPYEAPTAPELAIDTTGLSVEEAGRRVLEAMAARVRLVAEA